MQWLTSYVSSLRCPWNGEKSSSKVTLKIGFCPSFIHNQMTGNLVSHFLLSNWFSFHFIQIYSLTKPITKFLLFFWSLKNVIFFLSNEIVAVISVFSIHFYCRTFDKKLKTSQHKRNKNCGCKMCTFSQTKWFFSFGMFNA